MTLGQRIAQKRKELGLSQEGLGEQLGVSRQAIYKWESDASLPEIEKLITLSRIFSVPVGWLLGVEEDAQPRQQGEELTEEQLGMVQEIVDRYLAAQPKPAPPKHRRLIRFCGLAAVLALVIALFNLFSKLDQVTQDYNNLRYSVDNVSNNVNSQINSITSRVEDILKSQNNLTAEWSTELISTDPETGFATFGLRAVPKTYVDGMTAIFQARSGETTVELPVEPGEDHAFSGQITCPITDKIDLSVIFLTGDKRETQWLEDYYGLYYDSFPDLTMRSRLWYDFREIKDGVLPLSDRFEPAQIWNYNLDNRDDRFLGWNPDPPAKLQVGLFRDRKLVVWYEGRTETINVDGVPTEAYHWYRPGEILLEPGEYCEAAVYTDEYGRQMIYPGDPEFYPEGEGTGASASAEASAYAGRSDPAGWEF